ncbi:hypothetical protein ACFTSF_31275 [Kribbella sp. NPDC056951]|uniref:hypothetical protein n=1 Tax=Kribbella sp. NPDC056951 TaxID=3345978 RepID=UPI003644472E
MMLRRFTAALATVTFAVACTACSGNNPKPPPFTPSVPSQSATPTPSAEGVAVEAASSAYRKFVAATDITGASGGTDTAELRKHASGVMLASELNQAETFRGKKWHSVGRQQVMWVKSLKVELPDATGAITSLTLQACVDSSKATAVDAQGKSVKLPGTPPQTIDEMRMRYLEGSWKADKPLSRKAGRC